MSDPQRAIVTQTAYPWRASLRTAAQTVLTVAALLVAVLPEVSAIVTDQLGPILPAQWIAVIVATLAGAGAVAATITRISLIPRVSDWLTRIGLGPVPKA